MSVLYNDVQIDQNNSQKFKSFDIYAVTIKIFMTEYHHLINGQVYFHVSDTYILVADVMDVTGADPGADRGYLNLISKHSDTNCITQTWVTI